MASSLSPELWFHRQATHYVTAQIYFHLNQVGVFSELATLQPRSASQLAELLHLDASVIDTLLSYLYEVDELLERNEQGQYSLSAMGVQVIERFSGPPSAEKRSINLFDVRVGGYGAVWAGLSDLAAGRATYGTQVQRNGKQAESGVLKLASHFLGCLLKQQRTLAVSQVLELGLTTGLLEQLGKACPGLSLFGLDRSEAALSRARERAAAANVTQLQLLQADLFEVDSWAPRVAAQSASKGMLFSLHFHEFLAKGKEALVHWLRTVRQHLPGWYVVALEQPRLLHSERATTSESLWLYAQSNVLIHHLIGNGRILTKDEWAALGQSASCPLVGCDSCDYLGYHAFVFEL